MTKLHRFRWAQPHRMDREIRAGRIDGIAGSLLIGPLPEEDAKDDAFYTAVIGEPPNEKTFTGCPIERHNGEAFLNLSKGRRVS